MGLHGCECTPVSADAARKLRSSVCTAVLGPHYSSSSPEIALRSSARTTLDPEIRILEIRLTAMRRGVHKNVRRGQPTEDCIKRILQQYHARGEYTTGGAEALARAQAAPPPASTNRRKWALQKRPAGPVALLLIPWDSRA